MQSCSTATSQDVLDRRRQSLGLVALAVARDLGGIPLKAVVVQDFAIGKLNCNNRSSKNAKSRSDRVSEPPTARVIIY